MKPQFNEIKPFAWAGIRMKIPAAWETGQLGNDYALLEHRFRPVFEFKTAIIRGRFSFRRHLKQLNRLGHTSGSPPLEIISPPPAWPEFPASSEVACFSWRGAQTGGMGLLHFCHQCRKATLLQFYEDQDDIGDTLPDILASFQDHDIHTGPNVAVYDIQAALPEDLMLVQHQFEAGRFMLVFGKSRQTITMWRWSPADIILNRYQNNLTGLVEQDRLLPNGVAIETALPIVQGLEWQWHHTILRTRIRNLIFKRTESPLYVLRIWHRQEANRILAIRSDGFEGTETFDRICQSYDVF